MTIQKLRPSFTFTQDRLAELQAVIPEAFADGAINWDVLKEALGALLEDEGREAEHFGLFWPGKREARRLATLPSKATLKPTSGEGMNEDSTRNIFIEGDNLEVLKLMQKSYAGQIKMIYIDPPYNTGNDFVYKDDFREPLEDYLRKTGQTDEEGNWLTTNTRTDGRFHSNWLNMIYPRLRLARQLLRDDGVIYISIDDHEAHHLRLVMNEVFGEENFVADIVVVNNLKGRNDKRYIATAHERLLMYVKENFEESGLKMPEERIKEFSYEDEIGRYRLLGLRKRGGADIREKRPKLFFPIYVNPKNNKVALLQDKDFYIEVLPRKSDNTDGCWRWGKSTVQRDIEMITARKVGNEDRYDIFEKDYLEIDGEIRRIKPKSVMMGTNYSTDGATKYFRNLFPEVKFDNPKAVPFLKDLIDYSTLPSSSDIILDFFAGSCTTAEAVLGLNREDNGNRRFIMVQFLEATDNLEFPTIAEIGKERIRKVITKINWEDKSKLKLSTRENQEDLGFKVFKLSRSNYKAWKDYEGEDIQEIETLFDGIETPLIEGWDREDLLTEILLIQGFPLDSSVIKQDLFTHNTILLVDSADSTHRLFVCLDDNIVDDTIEHLHLHSEDVFVCLDSALSNQTKMQLADVCNLSII